jgi:hypothetical protein
MHVQGTCITQVSVHAEFGVGMTQIEDVAPPGAALRRVEGHEHARTAEEIEPGDVLRDRGVLRRVRRVRRPDPHRPGHSVLIWFADQPPGSGPALAVPYGIAVHVQTRVCAESGPGPV